MNLLCVLRPRFRSVGLVVALLTVAGCGGHGGGGPAAPAPGVPQLSNLQPTFGGGCTIAVGAGTVLTVNVDYLDSDGDVRGGTLQTTGTFQPSGNAFDLDFPLPSQNATVTGTTQGTITVRGCVRFGASTTFTLAVAMVDKAQHSSNIVSTQLNRPAGAPEMPQSSDPRGTLEPLYR